MSIVKGFCIGIDIWWDIKMYELWQLILDRYMDCLVEIVVDDIVVLCWVDRFVSEVWVNYRYEA